MECCICKGEIEKKFNAKGKMVYDTGNNARPIKEGRCCDVCDATTVIPERIKTYIKRNNHP